MRDAIKLLEYSLDELAIQDVVRKSKRMPLPADSLLVDFNIVAKDVMDKVNGSFESHRRDIIEFFGAPVIVIAKLWELIWNNNCEATQRLIRKKEHLLWALHYMKQAPNFTVLCKTIKMNAKKSPTKKTVLKWVWFYVREISALQDQVILWENRKTNDVGNDCLVSVDCVDCPFQQILIDHPTKPGKKTVNKALFSYKMNGPALRYEVGLWLLSNDIVWINGPFCPGDWNDLVIFHKDLKYQLGVGERVEADNIYVGEAPMYVVCPASCLTKDDSVPMMKRVEGRHEALNKHIKNWRCLKGPFDVRGTAYEKMEKHGHLFRACAVAKQVAMQMGVGELYKL